MEYVLDGRIMNEIDEYTIQTIGIPSMVLMERAALKVVEVICDRFYKSDRILIVCGSGNNGGDGVAVARILKERGYVPLVYLVSRDRMSEELKRQVSIAERVGVQFVEEIRTDIKYNLIVDAIFGIGLSRTIEGKYKEVIDGINNIKAKRLAVDIPSGINATTGQEMGVAVKANVTVTFGFKKTGLMLYPGAFNAGEIVVADIGFVTEGVIDFTKQHFTMNKSDLGKLPKRSADANKGTFGKVLVIAGSRECSGAALLSARAALKSGAGMVSILTHANNREVLSREFPEALIKTYESELEWSAIKEQMDWSDAIVIGPGMGTDEVVKRLLGFVLETSSKPVVVDADAINIIAKNRDLLKKVKSNYIFTPHLKEMSRLWDCEVGNIKANIIDVCRSFANTNKCVCILKDSRSIVAKSAQKVYINSMGNSGMATAGSGDVLTGIVAAMLAQGLGAYTAACYGTLIHSLAGDFAKEKYTEYSMTAGDIVDNLCNVFKLVR